ncbi:MAG: Ldh family oxidoreductase [Phycisphaerales bacterium]|nr:Ldh family oxidoreductase [Phycisphaerales bacterium]
MSSFFVGVFVHMAINFIVPPQLHNDLVAAAYRGRGFSAAEAAAGARFSALTAWHGIKTHNAIKALHLDELFGSKAGGCKPGAEIERLASKFKAVERWNGNRKLGQAVAFEAMGRCMELADEYGSGTVAVDNAFHYLWGGGYVIEAAKKGYIAYTCCTAALAEVVPFGGRFPTLGTNPHSWGFPTQDEIGFPICIDWATSTVAMGRVQQFVREGKQLPPGTGVDEHGNETTDPTKVKSLFPFGQHKGYGLALMDELYAAYIGGSTPTLRNRWAEVAKHPGEKGTCCFFFQCIRPDAISGDDFAAKRSQKENVKVVLADILGHGNEKAMLPGQLEAAAAALSAKHGGLLFTQAEIEALGHIAEEAEFVFDVASLKTVEI